MLKHMIRGWWTIGVCGSGVRKAGVEGRATSRDLKHPANSRNRVLSNQGGRRHNGRGAGAGTALRAPALLGPGGGGRGGRGPLRLRIQSGSDVRNR